MLLSAPGSARLREILEPFIQQGGYETCSVCLDTLSMSARVLIEKLSDIQSLEDVFFSTGAKTVAGYTRQQVHVQGCALTRQLIEEAPDLMYHAGIRIWAVRYGAIPDPASNLLGYNLADGSVACWSCGRLLHEDADEVCNTCIPQQLRRGTVAVATQQQMQQRGPVR